jgi:hypothetical protein
VEIPSFLKSFHFDFGTIHFFFATLDGNKVVVKQTVLHFCSIKFKAMKGASAKIQTSNAVELRKGWLTRFVRWLKGRKDEPVQAPSIDTLLQEHSYLVQTGIRTKATVLDINDDGKMVNFNPIVCLTLRLDDGSNREIAPEAIVSLLQLPQIQQQINIAYLPEMPHLVAII